MTCQVLNRANAPTMAYDHHPGTPTILYLSGYRGDRAGSKAAALARHIAATSYGLVRFDYRGHGESGGDFDTSRLSDWLADAQDILTHIVPAGPVIVVGSSMGGWLGLHLALQNPDRIKGFIGLAAAPDFTDDMVRGLNQDQRAMLAATGRVTIPSNTPGYDPYVLTQEFLNDGGRLSLLNRVHPTVTLPMVLIQGDVDRVVARETPERIARHFPNANVTIRHIPTADHSLARAEDLAVLYASLDQLISVYI